MARDSAPGCCHVLAIGGAMLVVGSSEEDDEVSCGEAHWRGEDGRELEEQQPPGSRLRALDLR